LPHPPIVEDREMLLFIWLTALVLIALWSFVTWGLHSLLLGDPTRVQELKPLIDQVPYREVLDRWLPGWQTLLQFLIDLTQGLLSGLANAAPWFAWALWGVGLAIVMLLAGGLTLLVVQGPVHTTGRVASRGVNRP
jgi:hypothetical protein